MKKIYCIKCNKNRKFKNPKITYFLNRTLVLSLFVKSVEVIMKKYLKKNQLRN